MVRRLVITGLVALLLTAQASPVPVQHVDPAGSTYALHDPLRGNLCAAVAVSSTHLLSAAHCGRGPFLVVDSAGKAFVAQVVAIDPEQDISVLRASRRLTSWARIDSSLPEFDEDLTMVGHPLGRMFSVSRGCRFSGLMRDRARLLYSMACPAQRGNSGGGIFDSRGHLRGIVSVAVPGEWAGVIPGCMAELALREGSR